MQTNVEKPWHYDWTHWKAFLLLSFSFEHSICLHRSSLGSAQIAGRLLYAVTSISARWTQLHKFSLAFMVCVHNDACACECEESGSELSLRHEERGKKSFQKWMKVEKWFRCRGSVGPSGILFLSSFLLLLTTLVHAFSFYPCMSSSLCQWLACF